METIHFPDDPRPPWLVHPVIALGNFDGLHRGHLKIIERVKRGAAEHGGTPMAMTFDPHPPRIVRPDKAPPLLMTKAQRLEALHRAGVQCVAVVRFTRELSEWDADTFVRKALVDWLRVSEVWVGANFLFGHGRTGTFSVLRGLGQSLRLPGRQDRSGALQGLRRQQHPDPAAGERGAHGRSRGAARPRVLCGRRDRRRAGSGAGSWGFRPPTCRPTNELVPPNGVYATIMTIDDVVHGGVTNIGMRPTFGETTPTIETHVLDYSGNLYGHTVRLAFVQRLRDERRFEDVDALRAQIDADKRRAERLFTRLSV